MLIYLFIHYVYSVFKVSPTLIRSGVHKSHSDLYQIYLKKYPLLNLM